MTITGQDWSDMDEGWLYGEWETGPWWAFHDKVFSNLLIAIFRPPENETESKTGERERFLRLGGSGGRDARLPARLAAHLRSLRLHTGA